MVLPRHHCVGPLYPDISSSTCIARDNESDLHWDWFGSGTEAKAGWFGSGTKTKACLLYLLLNFMTHLAY